MLRIPIPILTLSVAAALLLRAPLILAQSPSPSPAAGPDFYHIVNATGGAFTDDQVSWSIDGRVWHTLAESKAAPALKTEHDGRLRLRLRNKTGSYEETVNYTHGDLGWFGSTSQVESFSFPYTIELFDADGTSSKAGISESRTELFEEFKKDAPAEFRACVLGNQRIVAPQSADLNENKVHAHYLDDYVNEIWDMFSSPKETPGGWTGRVVNGALIFSKPGQDDMVLRKKPTTKDILAGINEMEKYPGFCAAFNRHVAADPGDWDNPATYYKALPCNFYAKFWHAHSINGKASAFRCDDYARQSSLLYTKNPVKIVITLYWDTPPKDDLPAQDPHPGGVALR